MFQRCLHWLLGVVPAPVEKALFTSALGKKATTALFPAKIGRLLVAGLVTLALLATLLFLRGRDDADECTVLQDQESLALARTRPAGWVQAVAFSPDGALLASGWGRPGTAGGYHLWDMALRRVLAVRQTASAVYAAAFSPDGKLLALGSWNGNIQVCEVPTLRQLCVLRLREERVRDLTFSPDGNVLVAGALSGVVLWDLLTGRERATYPASYPLALSPDGRLLATGTQEAAGARLWDWQTGQALGHLQGAPLAPGPTPAVGTVALAFAPDGKTLISADSDTTVRFWDVEQQRLQAALPRYTNQFGTVAFSPNRRLLATGGSDRSIVLWDASTSRQVAMLQGHTGAIHCLAFSPDGQKLASGGFDGTVRLWNLAKALEATQP